jgi:hypothetical protein
MFPCLRQKDILLPENASAISVKDFQINQFQLKTKSDYSSRLEKVSCPSKI